MRRILFVPDTHAPYENKRAWALMLKAARDFKPHTIVHLGDLADFYSVSAHEKDPARQLDLVSEIGAVNDCLDSLDALGAKRKIFCQGNHENRLERYLASEAPALAKLPSLSVSSLFDFQTRGWRYVPYRSHAKVGKLHVTHDVGHSGKYALNQTGAAFEANVVIGHTHRMGAFYFGNAKGEAHVAASFGWLGDAAAADYMHRIKASREWMTGFGVGYELPSGTVHLQCVPIVRNACVLNGKLYK